MRDGSDGGRPLTDWGRIDRAVRAHPAGGPVLALDHEALIANAADLQRRAGGVPIRVASKSLRVRGVIEEILAMPGFAGVLAYDLREACWLAVASHVGDVLLGYPSADVPALRALAADPQAAARVTLLVDSREYLDFLDAALPPAGRPRLRVAIDMDTAFIVPVLGRLGALRSPVRTADEARALALEITRRSGLDLVGIMAYEAQVAGVPNGSAGPVGAARSRAVAEMQRRSMAELIERRGRLVEAVRQVADLEFVNGGGTGSVEATAADPSVTDIAAGSGLFAGHLFDGYAHFTPRPALGFGLPVVRRPGPGVVTCHGGGWIASGPPGRDRLPRPVWPVGLRLTSREAAGEVQTPLLGAAADTLSIGDRVWFRHAKSGEVAERADEVLVVRGEQVSEVVPTYRGEGRTFV